MSSRMARLVFGLLPARNGEFGDACVADVGTAVPAVSPPRLNQIPLECLADETLVAHLKSGVADALTVLFERHSPLLFGIARRILRNGTEAEDAVQQVFLDVFRSIQQYDPNKGEFKTWLLMFGYQRILNCRRRLVSHRFFDTDSFDEILPELVPVPKHAPDFSPAEAHVLIEEMLLHLQPRQRRTIELIYYEGLTAEEVSVRTGETVRVVRHNLYRGLDKLRKALGGESSSARGTAMITNHDDFEVLCAVAASGRLTRGEGVELAEHLRHCVSCEKRLIEMRQLAIHLLLAPRFGAPGKHVRQGMQERFAERAIREGIPLSSRSQGIGFGSLSLVGALLVVLLLVAATLRDGMSKRPVLETEVATADGAATINHRESSAAAVANNPVPLRERTSRVTRHRLHPDHGISIVAVRASAGEPETLPGRQFTFTPDSRNSGMRAYPLSTTIRPPEVVPALTFSYVAPGLTLDASSEVLTHGVPRLPGVSERLAMDTFHFRSKAALQRFPRRSDVSQTTLKANLKDNAFQLIHDMVPELTSQERSQ